MGGNSEEDDREFATAARLSDINLGLYRTFVQPWVRGLANEGWAEWMRRLHPQRIQYEIFARSNPLMRLINPWVEVIKGNRHPVPVENPFWQAQEWISDWMETSLNAYRDVRDHAYEGLFHAIYGSPLLQAMVGLKASDQAVRSRPGKDAAHLALVAERIRELKEGIPEGGPREALIRALLYIRLPDGVVDERGFNFLRRMRKEAGSGLTLSAFKKLLREQFYVLLLDERRAVAAIPAMLEREPDLAARMANDLVKLLDVAGLPSSVAKTRFREIDEMLKVVRRRSAGTKPGREQRELEPAQARGVHAAKDAKNE
jgi:hypothetical protein